MATIDDRISELELKLKQAKAKKQQIEARKRTAETKKVRALDTKKKVLAGALLLQMMEEDEQTRQKIMARLDKFLTRTQDRVVFGLEPLIGEGVEGGQGREAALANP
jgi:large subunit ribosomal protein L7/L12